MISFKRYYIRQKNTIKIKNIVYKYKIKKWNNYSITFALKLKENWSYLHKELSVTLPELKS